MTIPEEQPLIRASDQHLTVHIMALLAKSARLSVPAGSQNVTFLHLEVRQYHTM